MDAMCVELCRFINDCGFSAYTPFENFISIPYRDPSGNIHQRIEYGVLFKGNLVLFSLTSDLPYLCGTDCTREKLAYALSQTMSEGFKRGIKIEIKDNAFFLSKVIKKGFFTKVRNIYDDYERFSVDAQICMLFIISLINRKLALDLFL
jgi:hypothetical protein